MGWRVGVPLGRAPHKTVAFRQGIFGRLANVKRPLGRKHPDGHFTFFISVANAFTLLFVKLLISLLQVLGSQLWISVNSHPSCQLFKSTLFIKGRIPSRRNEMDAGDIL